jgi:hypothetical protein
VRFVALPPASSGMADQSRVPGSIVAPGRRRLLNARLAKVTRHSGSSATKASLALSRMFRSRSELSRRARSARLARSTARTVATSTRRSTGATR